MGIPVDVVTRPGFIGLMEQAVETGRDRGRAVIVQPLNVDTFNKTRRDRWLRDWFNTVDVVYADGQGIVWGARAHGQDLPERLTAADLIWDMAEAWDGQGPSIYLLGGPEGLSRAAAEALTARHPGLRIAGVWRGHLSADEDLEAIEDIRRVKPDILAVGFGTPYQERWIARYWAQLRDIPCIWPVGAMASYVAGTVPRAPDWMLNSGLEWAFRFGLEPRRLFTRYVVGNPLFIARVAGARVRSLAGSRRR